MSPRPRSPSGTDLPLKKPFLLHHWIDGRIAHPDDPDYFCSGCNLQTLYVLRYLQEELGVPLP